MAKNKKMQRFHLVLSGLAAAGAIGTVYFWNQSRSKISKADASKLIAESVQADRELQAEITKTRAALSKTASSGIRVGRIHASR